MGPREPTRRQIIDWLAAAAEHSEHAEIYHATAINPQALDSSLARQAARDAAAMQLIELAGCAEGFTRERGEPGTTLAQFDDALRPLFQIRAAHVHPEFETPPPAPVTSTNLSILMGHLKAAVRNLDPETWKIQAPDQQQALTAIYHGLTRIEKDGLPDPAALRPRDLHYAGYYHEIQFGRLAKATGLYENWNSPDPRRVDVNRSIFDADDMAHKFHAMRAGPGKSRLPVSVVSPEHRGRVPGRALSALMRELRHEYQRPEERLEELAKLSAARAREEYRDSVRGLAQQYVRMTEDANAAAAVHDYVQRQKPPLDREMIDAMRHALHTAADPGGDYLGLPEAVRNRCLDLCLTLDSQGDRRLLYILDAADGRGRSHEKETEALIRGLSRDTAISKAGIESHSEFSEADLARLESDFLKDTPSAGQDQVAPETEFRVESIRVDPWSAVHLDIPANAGQELLKEAHATVVQCCQAVSHPPGPFDIYAPDNGQTPDRNFEVATRRLKELGGRLQAGLEPNERAGLAEDILDRQASEHSHYDIAPWQDGFAVFRIHEIEDGMPEQYRPPTGQQVLGWAETIDRLQDAIIDGSALTASPQWVTDEQMIEADKRYTIRLAEAIDDDGRRHSDDPDRESINEDREALYDTETGERLGRGEGREAEHDSGEPLYDTETGERLETGGRDITGRPHGGGRGQSH